MITRVRVPAQWAHNVPDMGAITYVNTSPATIYGIADFQLGVGPCGKTVERLDVFFHSYGVEIVQICTCTEQKNFVYPWATVTGRVEVTHA